MIKKVNNFKILSDAEHLRMRPNMYIGSTSLETKNVFIEGKYEDLSYIPGLYKIVNEIIDNALDVYITSEGNYGTKISVNIDDHSFSVIDNGTGIPVEYVKNVTGEKIYQPVAAWTQARSGTNFVDERVTAGANGVGSFCLVAFSKKFVGDSYDGKKHLRIIVEDTHTKSIKVNKTTKHGVEVYAEPDFTLFGVDKFDETFKRLLKDRIINISLAYPKIDFRFNGQKCNKTLKQFIKDFPDSIIHHDNNTVLAIMPSDGEFRFHAVTNGLINYNGGSHIDYVMNQIIPPLRDKIKTKYKYDLMPAKLKSSLQIILILNGFKNAKFDSQTKERITNTLSEVSNHLGHIDYDDFVKKIFKNDKIITPIIEAQKLKLLDEDEDAAKKKSKELRNKKVANHIEATSKISDKKSIYLVEGLSAASPFIEARNQETQGVLPLQGKILNVNGKKAKDILDNAAISNIMNVIGLEWGKKASNLNYGNIVIMTDADMDGISIQGLLINLLYLWPELFEKERVKILNSPKYILRGKKDKKYFYTDDEWNNYKGSVNGYELSYIKGLGSLEIDEYKDMLKNPKLTTVVIDDPSLLTMMYGDDPSLRKQFMMK